MKKADGVKGFLLYNPFIKEYFFRIYNEDKTFVDYDLRTEEIEVQIIDPHGFLTLKEDGDSNELTWSDRAKGKKNEPVEDTTN